MGLGKDEWEKAADEEEQREFAQALTDKVETVRRRIGEEEWRRIRLWGTVGSWMIGIGLLVAGYMALTLLYGSIVQPWLSRVAPSGATGWEPFFQGRPTLLRLLMGGGLALFVAGLLVVRFANQRLRRAAGSDDAEAALMYLSLGAKKWEEVAGEAKEEAGEAQE